MEALNHFGAIVGFAALILGALIYLYSTAKQGRQDIIRQDNKDLRESNQEMRIEKSGLEAAATENRETIKQLRDIATQTPAVTKLIGVIETQQKQAAEQHSQVLAELSKVTSSFGSLAKEFSGLAKAINNRENSNAKSR